MSEDPRPPEGPPAEPGRPEDHAARQRLGLLTLSVLSALFFAGALAYAIGGGLLSVGGEDIGQRERRDLPREWTNLIPLRPVGPELVAGLGRGRDASEVAGSSDQSERGQRGRDERGQRGRDAGRDGSPTTARLGPIPGALATRLPRPRVVTVIGPLAPPRLPGVVELVSSLPQLPGLGIIPGIDPLPVGGVDIPPVDPFPGGVDIPPGGLFPGGLFPGGLPRPPTGLPIPGIPRPRIVVPPINVTLGNLRADSRFDVLLVSSGRLVLERYVFLDGDIAGLSAQINLGSRLLAAEALRDGAPLARVAAAPLSVGGANAALLGGGAQAGGRTRGGSSPGAGPGPGAPPQASAAGAGGDDRPQRGRRSGAGSVGGGGSSSPKSAQGSPRRAGGGSNATRPSTRGRSRPRRASPGSGSPRGGSPRGRNRPARRGNGGSPPRGRRSSPGSGRGHDKGRGRDDDKGHGRDDDKGHGRDDDEGHGRDDDEDDDDD